LEEQITITRPWRRMTRHFSQIRRTEGRTFMVDPDKTSEYPFYVRLGSLSKNGFGLSGTEGTVGLAMLVGQGSPESK